VLLMYDGAECAGDTIDQKVLMDGSCAGRGNRFVVTYCINDQLPDHIPNIDDLRRQYRAGVSGPLSSLPPSQQTSVSFINAFARFAQAFGHRDDWRTSHGQDRAKERTTDMFDQELRLKNLEDCTVSTWLIFRMIDPRTLGCSSTVHLCTREEICSGCTCDPPYYAAMMVPWYTDGRTVEQHQSYEYTCPGCKESRFYWYNFP